MPIYKAEKTIKKKRHSRSLLHPYARARYANVPCVERSNCFDRHCFACSEMVSPFGWCMWRVVFFFIFFPFCPKVKVFEVNDTVCPPLPSTCPCVAASSTARLFFTSSLLHFLTSSGNLVRSFRFYILLKARQ